jgi:hypothetical protein
MISRSRSGVCGDPQVERFIRDGYRVPGYGGGPDPGDSGWHVDVGFPGHDCDPNEQHDFSGWRVNVSSRGRADRSPVSWHSGR